MEPLFLIACLSVAAVDLPAALPCASPCTDGQCELSVVVTADVHHSTHAQAAARRSVGVVRKAARVATVPLKAVRRVRLICPRRRGG